MNPSGCMEPPLLGATHSLADPGREDPYLTGRRLRLKGRMLGRVGRETLGEGRDRGHAEASSLRRRGRAAGGLRRRLLAPAADASSKERGKGLERRRQGLRGSLAPEEARDIIPGLTVLRAELSRQTWRVGGGVV